MARILLADDETATLDLVRKALSSDGHSVEVADSGVDAVERLARAPGDFQVLLTDVNMPGMDGFELAAKARALDPALRVVIMSGLIEQLERAKVIGSPRYLTLAKPFTLDDLRAVVRSAAA